MHLSISILMVSFYLYFSTCLIQSGYLSQFDTSFWLKIIMHQTVKLTDVIWLLQLVISSSLIHAMGDPSQALTGIRTRVPSLRGRRLTNWAIPPPIWQTQCYRLHDKCCFSSWIYYPPHNVFLQNTNNLHQNVHLSRYLANSYSPGEDTPTIIFFYIWVSLIIYSAGVQVAEFLRSIYYSQTCLIRPLRQKANLRRQVTL